MSYFSPTQFLNNLYTDYYLAYLTEAGIDPKAPNYKYLNDWCMDTRTLDFVRDELSFQVDKYSRAKNKGKHYNLLRIIVYNACKYFRNNDKNYIEFIQSILMVILEGESMTQAYEVNSIEHPDPHLHALLSILPLYNIFYDKTVHFIRISNTSVHKLLNEMNIHICRDVENHLRTTRSSSTRSTIYKTTSTIFKTKKTRKAEDDGSDDEDRTSAQGRKKKSRKKKTKKRKAKKHKKYKD